MIRRLTGRTFLTLVLAGLLGLGFMGVNGPAQAAPKTKQIQGKATKTATAPAGMVTAAEALKRIRTHMATITQHKDAMAAKVEYKPSIETMTEAFRRNGASQWATEMYASTWGQNYLYLAWDDAKPFYTAHYNALQESERDITNKKKPFVRQADLAYLDQGMSAWKSQEEQLQKQFAQGADLRGKQARLLGERQVVFQRKFQTADEATRKMLERQYEQLSKQADQYLNQAGDIYYKQIRQIGWKTRLFSAITSPEGERIAVPEPTEPVAEDCRPSFSLNRNVPPPVSYNVLPE